MCSKIFNSKKLPIIILVLVVLFQLVSLTIVGAKKEGYHIDEIYTYILSNSYDANRISDDTNAMTSWNAGEYFDKFVVVDENEGFAYGKVKFNNGLDAHPPFYYYIIHTISSFFQGSFNKWIGLILNYLLFVGIQLILYLLTSKITDNKYYGIAAVALNGGLTAVLDMMLFTRMYSLLTFFALLFVYIHYLIYLNPHKKRLYIFSAIITFLGVYTQYYFAFLAFFVAAAYCLWLLKNRNFKMLVLYLLSMLTSVIMVFVIFPAGISQITGSETNNIGKEVSGNIFNFAALPSALFSMSFQIIKGFANTFFHYKILSIICVFATVTAAFLLRNKSAQNDQKSNLPKMLLTLGILLVLVIVTITHISGKFTYVRYVYYLFPLFSLFAVLFAVFVGIKSKFNLKVLCVGIICFGIIGTTSFVENDLCSYTYKESHENDTAIINQCQDKPLILISNGSTYQPTANFEILRNASHVYICNFKKEVDIDKILSKKDIENGVVFMVLTDRYWSDGFEGDDTMKKITEQSTLLDSYEYYCNSDFSSIYIAK